MDFVFVSAFFAVAGKFFIIKMFAKDSHGCTLYMLYIDKANLFEIY